jgi:hypothetical protein
MAFSFRRSLNQAFRIAEKSSRIFEMLFTVC